MILSAVACKIPERRRRPRPPPNPRRASTKSNNSYNALRSDLSIINGEGGEESQLGRKENEEKKTTKAVLFALRALSGWTKSVKAA